MYRDPETEAKRAAVLREAERLFSRQGYPSVTLREIADDAMIEAGEVYALFSSKEAILWEIAIRCARDFKHNVEPIARKELQTLAKLSNMIQTHVEVVLRNRNAAGIFINEWRHLHEPRRSEYVVLRDEYERLFRQVLAKGIEEHLFREVDEKLGAMVILSALNATHQWYRQDRGLSVIDVGKNLTDLLLYGLLKTA